MRKSIEDRLSNIERDIRKLDLNVMLTLQSQNTQFYYHTSLFSEQIGASLASIIFGLISLLGLGVSIFALWKVGGELSYLITALLIFVFTFILYIFISLKSFFSWRASKVMDKIIGDQKVINEAVSRRVRELSKELGFDVNANIQTLISRTLGEDSSVTR
jgi:hypothetical protein